MTKKLEKGMELRNKGGFPIDICTAHGKITYGELTQNYKNGLCWVHRNQYGILSAYSCAAQRNDGHACYKAVVVVDGANMEVPYLDLLSPSSLINGKERILDESKVTGRKRE